MERLGARSKTAYRESVAKPDLGILGWILVGLFYASIDTDQDVEYHSSGNALLP
jgi:hypothetical protein